MKLKASFRRFFPLSSIVLAGAFAAQSAMALTYDWTPLTAGTRSWDDVTSNWTTSFPNLADDIANLNKNFTGAQTINLNQAITVGTLNLGDTGSTYYSTTIAAGTAGSLIMDVTSGSATISKATSGNNVTDTISAGIQLNDNLIVDNAATGGALVISGSITQSGGDKTLTKNGAGTLTLSTGNNYNGGTILNAGTLRADHATALGTGSLTINGGTLRVGATFTNNNLIVANSNFTISGASTASTGSGQFRIAAPITISGGGDNADGASLGVIIGGVITDATGGNTLNAFDASYNISGTTSGLTLDGAITLRGNQTLRVNIPATTSGMTIRGAIGDGVNSYGATFGLTAGGSMGSYTPGGRGAAIFLGGANTYDGATTINSGVNLVLGLANGSTTGSLNALSNIVNYGNFYLRRTDTITQGTHFGAISGSGNVLQTTGTATLTGTNTYTGSTTLLGGTLIAETNANLGTGLLTFNGGTLRFATGSSLNLSRQVVMTGNGTVDTSLASGTISGVISGTGALTKTGNNNLTISGVNTFTGDTTISGGKVVLGNALSLQNSAYNTAGSTGTIGLDFNGLTTPTLGGLSGSVSLATGTTGFGNLTSLTLNPQSGKTPSYSGVIGVGAGSLSLTKTGAGTQTLTGANTFSGGLTIQNGTLVADTATNATVLQTMGLSFTGTGTFQLKGLASNVRSQAFSGLTLSKGAATIDANNVGTSTTITLGGITRTAGATVDFKATTGTFGSTAIINTTQANDANGILGTWATVGGANWAINNGSDVIAAYASYTDIALGGAIAEGTTTNVRINSGASGNITLGAGTTNINTLLQNHTTAATVDTATKTLRFGTGGGIMVGTGKQALTIGTAANSGTITAGGNAVDVAGELVLNNSSSNGLTINSTIANNGTGAVSVVKSGTGLLTLSGTNTFSGGFTLNSGAVTPTHASALGTGKLILNGGGITVNALTLGAFTEIVMNGDWAARTGNSGAVLNTGTGPITLNAPVTIDVTNSVLTLGGTITGPGSANALDILIKRSDGQNAAVNFTQGIVLRGNQVANLIRSDSNGGSFPSITYSAPITDGGNGYGLTFSSPTTYNLNGLNSFTGAMVINSGSSVILNAGGTIKSTAITINTGGSLALGVQNLGAATAKIDTTSTITNNGVLKIGDNVEYIQGTDFPSGISGTGSVAVTGVRASGVTLNGTNTYSGGTSVIYTGGGGPVTLNINSANAIGTGTLTLSQSGSNGATINNTSGGAITLASNNAQNWNGPFTFTGTNSLNLGTGTVTLTNSPTVTVSANTLTVGGTVNGSGNTLTKMGAGTLALNGTSTIGSLVVGGSAAGGSVVVGSGGIMTVGSGTGNSLSLGDVPGGSSGSGVLDVSASTQFTANVGTFSVGSTVRGNGGGGAVTGTLNLGTSNTITATTFYVGNGGTTANPTGGAGTVTTASNSITTINTGALNIGVGAVSSTSFTLGSGAALNLQGSAGSGSRANLTIGDNRAAWSGGTMKFDLLGGEANLKLGALVIGTTTGSGQNVIGQLLMSSHADNTLDVNVNSGNAVRVGYSATANNATGTLTLGNLDANSAIATSDASAAAILIGFKSGAGASTGTLNLNGGTVTLTTGGGAAIAGGGGTSTLNLDGGVTLKAGASNSSWITGLTTAEIKSGGATINTNTYDIGISQLLSGAGGLTKTGDGTLTLSTGTTHSYAGPTNVTGGTLVVNGNISTSTLTTIGNGTDAATLQGTGTTGALTIAANAFHNPGNSPGIQNVIGDYTMAGTLTTEINGLTAGTEHDQVNVTGTVSLSGNLVATFSGTGYAANDLIFILLNDNNDDDVIGTFSGLAQGATVINYDGLNWIISYNADSTTSSFTTLGGNDIALMAVVVPEPGAALIGGLGLLALLRRRRVA